MSEKIGKQYDQLNAGRQRGAAPLMGTVSPADVSGDTDTELIQHFGDVTQPVGPNE